MIFSREDTLSNACTELLLPSSVSSFLMILFDSSSILFFSIAFVQFRRPGLDRKMIIQKTLSNHTGDAEMGIPILSVICPVTIRCIRSFIMFLLVSVHGVRSCRSSHVITFFGGSWKFLLTIKDEKSLTI